MMARKFILTGLAAVFSFLFANASLSYGPDGILTIDATNWSEQEAVSLSGKWLTPPAWERANPGRTSPTGVPMSLWTNDRLLKAVMTIRTIGPQPLLSLEFPPWYSPFQLWVNGEIVISNSLESGPFVPLQNPAFYILRRNTNAYRIVFMTAASFFPDSRPWESIRFGKRSHNLAVRNLYLILESVLLGVFLFAFFVNASRFVIHRHTRKPYLYFFLLCLIYASITFLSGATTDMLAGFDWSRVFRILLTLYNLSLVFWILYEKTVHSAGRFAFLGTVLLAVSIVSGFIPLILPAAALVPFQLFWIPIYALILVLMLVFFRRDESSRLLMTIRILSVLAMTAALAADFIILSVARLFSLAIPFGALLMATAITLKIALHIRDEIGQAETLAKKNEILEREWSNLKNRQASLLKHEEELVAVREEIRKKRDEFLGRFTAREREILDKLARGDSYREISEALFVSEKTVDNHAQNIYKKAEVRGRGQLLKLIQNLDDRPA